MLLLANILFSIGSICAASQDGPFKYDMSREVGVQGSNYMDPVKEELLSKFIQNTFELSNNDGPRLNLIESNSIIDDALVEPFTDKYDKESNLLDESTRMKRGKKLIQTAVSVPAIEVSAEDEPVHGFVRQLIPSLLPIPTDGNFSQSNTSGPTFAHEFEDMYNLTRIDGRGHGTNATVYGGDGNTNGISSTNTSDGAAADDRKKEEERKKEEDRKKEDGKNDILSGNGIHENWRQPVCPTVSPGLNINPFIPTPAPGTVESSTVRIDIRPRTKLDEPKPTPSSLPIYPPQNRRDGEVICADRSLGKNCSEYIISLYGDEMALYLKITSPLKPGLMKNNVPKYTLNQLPYYVRRNVDSTVTYVPKSSKTVTPIYKPSPKYFNAAKNYVKPTSTPTIRSVATNRGPMSSQRRMSPALPYPPPKYMKERRMQVYPTQRTTPEPRSIARKPSQQPMPVRNMTPRSVSVPKKALPTRPAKPNIPELTNQILHKLKLLRDLSAAKIKETAKLQNRVKQAKPDPRLVSKYGNKIATSSNHKQKATTTAFQKVVPKSDVQNMILPPKQKYPEKHRPNPYQMRGKYANVPKPKPKPDHLPGVISGLTKREGVTFFNYYPFKENASGKRMKRSVAESKSKKRYNFFVITF